MNEINRAISSTNIADVRARRAATAAGSRTSAAGAAGLKRATDNVQTTTQAQAMSKMQALPAVRTELVNRMKSEVNSPDYNLNGKFSQALDRLLTEIG
jgi:anti-sigma28 factor (negative regulator of flagellin synthesis)